MTSKDAKAVLTTEQAIRIIVDSLQLLRDVPADVRNIKEELVVLRRDMAEIAVTLKHQQSK